MKKMQRYNLIINIINILTHHKEMFYNIYMYIYYYYSI